MIYFGGRPRARGGIGRRAGFRFQCRNASEFESLRAQDDLTGNFPNPYTSSVARGSSSVVEHRLAKARVASSNLVFRSIFLEIDADGGPTSPPYSLPEVRPRVCYDAQATRPDASRTRDRHFARRIRCGDRG